MSALLGALFGSFATVAVSRWPRGSTVTDPSRSRCLHCAVELGWRDNVPIVSWLLLRGRCRACGARYGARYLFIEVAMVVLFATVGAVHAESWLLPALLVATWAFVVAAAIDLEFSIIPNRLTLTAPLVIIPLVAIAAAVDSNPWMFARSLLAGIAIPVVMLTLSEVFRLIRGQAGIGMGDIKLAVSIGLAVGALGGWHVVVFAYAAVLSAVIVALGLMAVGRARMASRIPFGPYLAFGAMVAIIFADGLRHKLGQWWYLARLS
ncbi:MAG: prepilin peptidase [Nitriliruptoraceae bacterium]